MVLLETRSDSAKQVGMNFVPAHHFLLLGQFPHQLGHVFHLHFRCVCLASVYYTLDLTIDIIEGLQEMHVAQLDPQFILVIDKYGLIINFCRAVHIEAIFDIN